MRFLACLLIVGLPAFAQLLVPEGPSVLAPVRNGALADVDGDGFQDVIVGESPYLQVYRGPAGLTSPPITMFTATLPVPCGFTTAVLPRVHSAADFNGDGNVDVFYSQHCSFGYRFNVALGSGTLAPWSPGPVLQAVAESPSVVFVGDVDGDGDAEAIAVRRTTNMVVDVFVLDLQGNAWVILSTRTIATATSGTFEYALGDYDGDSRAELFLRLAGARHTLDDLDSPSPTLISLPWNPVQDSRTHVTLDLNQDGFDDVVGQSVTQGSMAPMHVLYGGPGGLTPMVTYPGVLPPDTWFRGGHDVDGDGALELFLWELTPNGSAQFPHRLRLTRQPVAGQPGSITTVLAGLGSGYLPLLLPGDIDGDGDDELVVHNGYANLAVFRNEAIAGPGCPGASGMPQLTVGASYPGNLAFSVGLSGAAVSAPAALLVSTSKGAGAMCSPGVDLFSLLSPTVSFGWTTTDTTGSATLNYPIPASPSLVGYTVFGQWAVVDPTGGATHAGVNYALSPLRTVQVF